jgi:hypothetical protein
VHSRGGEGSDAESLQLLDSTGFHVLCGRVFDTDQLADLLRQYGAELQAPGDRILIGGGDGTINQLLPRLLDMPAPIGLLPLGTANDLARTLGLPLDIEGGTSRRLAVSADGEIVTRPCLVACPRGADAGRALSMYCAPGCRAQCADGSCGTLRAAQGRRHGPGDRWHLQLAREWQGERT